MGKPNIWFPPTPKQETVIRILRQVFALPSLIGAAYIVQHVLRSKKRRRRVFTRVMLGMSVHDLIFSFVAFCSVWPAPKGTGFKLAVGTWASCEAFGYMYQATRLASILYNTSLAHYYLLTIRFGWSEWKCRKKVEPWMHLVPLVIGWGAPVVGFPINAYNPYPYGCGFRTYPLGCAFAPKIPCLRGNLRTNLIIGQFTFYTPYWITFVYIVVAMCMIYRGIAAVEEKSRPFSARIRSSHSFSCGGGDIVSHTQACNETGMNAQQEISRDARAAKMNDLKRKFSRQALLYCLALVFTWIFSTVNASLFVSRHPKLVPVAIVSSIFGRLQGFWNAVIYVLPRYLRHRQKLEDERLCPDQQENLGSDHQGEVASRSRERTSAFRQALSVEAEDDEDDYEYVCFDDPSTPQVDDVSLIRMVHFGTPVVEDYIEPTAAAAENFDMAETKDAVEPGRPRTLEEIAMPEEEANERIRDSTNNLPAVAEYTSHGMQLVMLGESEDAMSEGHESTSDAIELTMAGVSEVAISQGEESTNDMESLTLARDLHHFSRRASF